MDVLYYKNIKAVRVMPVEGSISKRKRKSVALAKKISHKFARRYYNSLIRRYSNDNFTIDKEKLEEE